MFFEIGAEIAAAINLYKKNKAYQVIIKCGHFEMETDFEEAVNGFCAWNTKKTMGVAFY